SRDETGRRRRTLRDGRPDSARRRRRRDGRPREAGRTYRSGAGIRYRPEAEPKTRDPQTRRDRFRSDANQFRTRRLGTLYLQGPWRSTARRDKRRKLVTGVLLRRG